MKNTLRLQQPLLNSQAINEYIQQGQLWNADGLPWPMREIRQGGSGDLSSNQQGNGIDFSETRPYQAGDEPRHINWRATARTGRPQVRVFHKDVSPQSYFLIDRRATMRFGTRSRLKVTQAARLAIFLASWEAQTGTELGALILNETPQWQTATNGQQGIYQLAKFASHAAPPLDTHSTFSLKRTLPLLTKQIPQGSHVYLLSDFYDLNNEMQAQLYELGQQHRVLAIHIYDTAEKQLPNAGHLNLCWGEQQELDNNSLVYNSLVDTGSHKIQKAYQLSFNERQQSIKQLCKKAGIHFISICSQTDNLAEALQATEK
jgi:uncharacterized protein (DUF58 family)